MEALELRGNMLAGQGAGDQACRAALVWSLNGREAMESDFIAGGRCGEISLISRNLWL